MQLDPRKLNFKKKKKGRELWMLWFNFVLGSNNSCLLIVQIIVACLHSFDFYGRGD